MLRDSRSDVPRHVGSVSDDTCRTAIWVAEQLTYAKFEVIEEDGRHIIHCTGISRTIQRIFALNYTS